MKKKKRGEDSLMKKLRIEEQINERGGKLDNKGKKSWSEDTHGRVQRKATESMKNYTKKYL